MKPLMILIILGVGGYFGYSYFLAPEAPVEPVAEASSPSEASPSAEVQSSGFAAELAESTGVSAAVDVVPEVSTGGTELKASIEKLDAQWTALSANGNNPTTQAASIPLAREYSKVLRALYAVPGTRAEQDRLIAERLQPLANSLFFSTAPYFDDQSGFIVPYEVKSGDNLNNIGRVYGMSYHFINMLRGKDVEDGNIRPGDRLKMFNLKEAGYQMHISKSEFVMDLFIGGIFARRFDIGHGEDITPTPTGITHITAREFQPQWTDPKTNRVYEYGEPGHILGPVWLAFDAKIGRNGLGIHGYTGDGQATGGKGSNGCIRMKNDEATLLYHILVPCATIKGEFITRAPMSVTIVD